MDTSPEVNDAESLDPENWDQVRVLFHEMVDDAIDYVQQVRERNIWQQMPDRVLASFNQTLPLEPTPIKEVYQQIKEMVLPYPMGNIHPRFWAWYMGSGTLTGAMADFWTSIMNPNLGGGNHAAHKIEEQVIDWIKRIIGFPDSASGLLVSGGSMANFTGLVVARNTRADFDVRMEGLGHTAGKMTVYSSVEVHSSNQKALEIMGLGSKSLRKIPVQEDYTINLDALRKQIDQDKKSGFVPFCVIGNAGTINTGAIDNLHALAEICKEESLWFHIDGAIGAIAMLDDSVAKQLRGLDLADSIALDLHKWLHIPFEAGCIVIRNAKAHKNTFALIPEYLAKNIRGVASGENWFSEYGLQLSRRFRALKVWMTMQEYGLKKLGRMITKNIQQAHYLETLINSTTNLELLAPIGLDIVCFRYNPGNLSTEQLNELNQEIKLRIEENAVAIPGYTTLNGNYCIRIAIANHRTERHDLKDFIEVVVSLGKSILNHQ